MVAPEAGYTTHHQLIASADTTHSPVTVTTSFSSQDTSRTMGHAVQPVSGSLTTPKAAKADAAPVYDPASLFFLGIALFGLAGICRRRLEAKKAH
ncbi:hypothetical protein [Desulfoluna butyratoxydans]|nr:hypothetical protein [Desulfoluna butyratoxydans]